MVNSIQWIYEIEINSICWFFFIHVLLKFQHMIVRIHFKDPSSSGLVSTVGSCKHFTCKASKQTKKLDKSSETEIFNLYFLSVSMLMLIVENGDVSDTLATNWKLYDKINAYLFVQNTKAFDLLFRNFSHYSWHSMRKKLFNKWEVQCLIKKRITNSIE